MEGDMWVKKNVYFTVMNNAGRVFPFFDHGDCF